MSGLSNGTFLGLSALTALHLSHNKIARISDSQLAGLESLELLYLDHNKLTSLSSAVFEVLTKLVAVTLNNNHLTQLDLSLTQHGLQPGLQAVTLHHNPWQCSSQQDCQWITAALHTFNRSAVRYLSRVTCLDGEEKHRNLLAFTSSCTNLDVLPVSAQTSTPPFLVIVISVAVVVLLMVFAIISFLLWRGWRKTRRHEVRVYLHYSSQDEALVRAEVGPEVGRVVSSLCYHHTDLSTQLSVGQAISAAVSASSALVITASPAYTESAITTAELHIIADCVLQQQSNYPVVVVSPGQSQLYLEQVRGRTDCGDDNDDFLFLAQIKQQFSLTVGSCSKQWVFLSDLSQLSSILDRYH